MKTNKAKKQESFTAPLLKDVVTLDQANRKANLDNVNVSIGNKPLDPPALYEDSGDGYNPDFTFPQN